MRVANGAFFTGQQGDGNEYYLHRLGDAPTPLVTTRPVPNRPDHETPDPLANRAVYGLVMRHCTDMPPRAMAEVVRRFGPRADRVIAEFGIGYCDTTTALVESLNAAGRRQHAINAGVLTAQGHVCRSLRGKLLIPYRRDGLVCDMRGAGLKDGGDTKAKSLLGGYAKRGVKGLFFNHDVLGTLVDGSTIHLAGGEWKAIALVLAGLPAIGTRGEGELYDEQLAALKAAGITKVVLHIDAEDPKSDRPAKIDGIALSAGRALGLKKAERLAEAGFDVRIAEPPRRPGTPKVDPDALLRDAGPEAVHDYAFHAPTLAAFLANIGLPVEPAFRPAARLAVTVDAAPEAVVPDATLPLIEESIKEKVRAFLHGEPAAGATLVITAPPGVGKTRQVLSEARSLHEDRPLAFFAPRHDLYGPEHEAAGLHHLYGRNADNCDYAKLATIIGSKGHSVDRVLCRKCPLQRECGYYDQFRRGGHRYAALPMLHTLDPGQGGSVEHDQAGAGSLGAAGSPGFGPVHAVVLDEVTPQDLVASTAFSRDDLVQVAGDPQSAAALRKLADLLIRALDQQIALRAGDKHGGALRGPGLLAALIAVAGGETCLRASLTEVPLDAAIDLANLTEEAALALPHAIATPLARAISDELRWRDDGQGGGVLTLDPHKRTYRITRRREARGWLADVPLIILNATADAAVMLDLLGRDPASAEVYDPHLALPPEVEVVQLTDTYLQHDHPLRRRHRDQDAGTGARPAACRPRPRARHRAHHVQGHRGRGRGRARARPRPHGAFRGCCRE